MSRSNYGYDANGWEREPFPARDEFAEPKRRVCEPCRRGVGTTVAGPQHCAEHDKHCTAAPCW